MKRLLQSAILTLLAVQLLAVPGWASPAPQPAAAAGAPLPALHNQSTTLQDDIFLNGADFIPAPQPMAYWGHCSQSCAACWSGTGCPKDDDGRRQSCLPQCP